MIKIQRINAIALTVADIARSVDFYTQALGFKIVDDRIWVSSTNNQLWSIPPTDVRLVTLQLGDEFIELIQYLDLKAKPIPEDSQSNDLWFQHLAIVVSDIDRAYEHLQDFPITPISNRPQTIPDDNKLAAGVRAFKFRELNHHSLELIWFPQDKGKEKWHQNNNDIFLGIDHSAIAVRDTEESLKFYCDLLNLEQEGTNLNQGQVQADLDGLPVAKVQVTPLQPIESSIGVELLDYQQPETGRERPQEWQINDIPHLHYVMEVTELEKEIEQLKQQKIELISPQAIEFPEFYRYSRGYLIKDPNGHAILLASDVTR
ncbi:VOC family protein [Pleurocapsa sp. PCC 7319]|uniref:VOC family protein n=1 Tax=Pleurocapsa sp. PCC 7319 TaxID=118161 RepID=UPI00034BAC5B|nr:VOC family protein [Pleurocapsa sp. PCC 7319]